MSPRRTSLACCKPPESPISCCQRASRAEKLMRTQELVPVRNKPRCHTQRATHETLRFLKQHLYEHRRCPARVLPWTSLAEGRSQQVFTCARSAHVPREQLELELELPKKLLASCAARSMRDRARAAAVTDCHLLSFCYSRAEARVSEGRQLIPSVCLRRWC